MSLCPDERTLYISNLDKNVTDDVLYELFLQAGPIERANIVSSNNLTNYGFITYKHEGTIEYAIELYKGTYLYNKELSIKRKGKSYGNSNGCGNNYGQYGFSESIEEYNNKRNSSLWSSAQGELNKGAQNFKLNDDAPMLFNFKGNSNDGNWSRNKPYDHGLKKYSSRSHEDRRRYKGRDVPNKSYYSRNRWH